MTEKMTRAVKVCNDISSIWFFGVKLQDYFHFVGKELVLRKNNSFFPNDIKL